ncbi:MAG: M48 family metallopeptidase [Endomicrobia bacterium]|nr:M48 family metallopeptidase [Endomicrobiia bacterium]
MKKILVIAFFVLTAGCSSVPITGRKQLSLIPDSQITQMSLQSYNELINQSEIAKTGEQAELVKKVGKEITEAAEAFLRENGLESEISNYSWEFNLIKEDKTVNAFCMPGGKIAVYTGILPVTKNADGLAVVIGHEVAHAIAKHGNERMSQALVAQFGGNVLSAIAAQKSEQTQQLIMLAYGAGTQLGVLLPYSRKHEYEADRIGLILMARAGYNPNAAVIFWQDMSAGSSGQTSDFFSTHPSDSKRIENLKNLIPEAMRYYKK